MIFTFVKPPHLHRTLNLCKNSTHFLQRMPLHSTKAVHIDNVFAACKLFSQRAKVRFNVQSNFHSLSRLRQHGGTILGSWPTRIFKRISRAANSQNVNKAQDKLSTSAKQGLNQMSVTNVAKPKNIKRLLALAKNEKWKLAGRDTFFFFYHVTSVVSRLEHCLSCSLQFFSVNHKLLLHIYAPWSQEMCKQDVYLHIGFEKINFFLDRRE